MKATHTLVLFVLVVGTFLSSCAGQQALKGEELTAEQFDRLEDGDVVAFQDKEYSVDDVRAQIRSLADENSAWLKANAADAAARFESARRALAAEAKASLDAHNREIASDIASMRGRGPSGGETRVDSGPDEVTPGQRLYVIGTGFGVRTGTLRLVFSSGSHRFLPVRIERWTSGIASGVLPAFPTANERGETDQKAQLELVTSDGHLGRWPVRFKATRDLALLSPSAITVRCASTGYHGACNAMGNDATLTGAHAVLFSSAGTSGTDVAAVTLHNGWVSEHMEYQVRRWGYTSPGGGVDSVDTCATGCAATKIEVHWHDPGDYYGGLLYALRFYITGPKGVSYR